MKLLIHTCCAPCAIGVLEEAKKDKFSVTGFFYNPNIHPASEYALREKEANKFFKSQSLTLSLTDYREKDFFEGIGETKNAPARCKICWSMRINKTVSFAKANGFDSFTTTLLASPYQDHEALKSICEDLSKRDGLKLYYKDFRAGFRRAQESAKKQGIYRQNYCGCAFSLAERSEKSKKTKKNTAKK